MWEKIVRNHYPRIVNGWEYLSKEQNQETAKNEANLPECNYYKKIFIELFEIEKKKDMWCALRRKTLDSVSGTPAASVSVVCLGDPGIGKTR